MIGRILRSILLLAVVPAFAAGQSDPVTTRAQASPKSRSALETTVDRNQRLAELVRAAPPGPSSAASSQDYRIGPDDLLAITVFEASDLNASLRVSADGEIAPPLLGSVTAAGLTPRELGIVLQELLRRKYMKDPHVSVEVSEMQSHPVSVLGAVNKSGVFQIRGIKTLLEILSMAEGLAPDAGDTVFVMRGSTPNAVLLNPTGQGKGDLPAEPLSRGTTGADTFLQPESAAGGETVEVSVKKLLESGDEQYNVPIYAGDIVKVTLAGVVYVVGEVKKPGGFPLRSNQKLTVLQVLALAEGLTPTAAKRRACIIRTTESGERSEVPVDLDRVLKGRGPDIPLQSKDILFVPTSNAKSAVRGSLDAFVRLVTVRAVMW